MCDSSFLTPPVLRRSFNTTQYMSAVHQLLVENQPEVCILKLFYQTRDGPVEHSYMLSFEDDSFIERYTIFFAHTNETIEVYTTVVNKARFMPYLLFQKEKIPGLVF